MKVAIISIGNELLNGKTVNSNASYIGGKLYEIGIVVEEIFTIRDEDDAIRNTLAEAVAKFDAIVITGGLGPTHDDITKKNVAAFFNSPLRFHEVVWERIEQRFRRRGKEIPVINREQAFFPEKARMIDNPVGSAPGMHFEENGKHVFVLPGVPKEMQAMIDGYVVPFLQKAAHLPPIRVHLYRTTAIAESNIYERCKELFQRYPDYEIAFLPKITGVDVRIADRTSGDAYPAFEKAFLDIVGKYVYARGNREIEEVIGELLRQQQKTLAVAESCTGGLVQNRITNVPGSSDYFMGGMVTYSNESKIQHLGVPREVLERYGAVSEEVAREMAAGVRSALSTDIGISTTGIAGPGGATPAKPVGLIYIGIATAEKDFARRFVFGKDRLINKQQGAMAALELLRRELTG